MLAMQTHVDRSQKAMP